MRDSEAIEETHGTAGAGRLWKLLVSLDTLLFGGMRDKGTANTKRQQIADRMDLIMAGQWSTAWYQASPMGPPEGGPRSEMTTRVRRVQSLLEAGEISRVVLGETLARW